MLNRERRAQHRSRTGKVLLLSFSTIFIMSAIVADVWAIQAAHSVGIEPIEIDSNYTLDSDLTFSGDGFIIESNDVILDLNGHTITGSEGGSGVYLEGRTGVTIKNGIIDNFGFGIQLINSRDTTLYGNTAIDNDMYGFYLYASQDTTLSGNTATNNAYTGFYLEHSNDATLSGNTATNHTGPGFFLEYSHDNTFSGNTATNHFTGFVLATSSNNTLSENTATTNTRNGFRLDSSHNNTLSGNTAIDSSKGYSFRLDSSHNNTLSGNTAIDNFWGGFDLHASHDNTLSGNSATASNWGNGFRLTSSRNNTLSGNTATHNDNYGISLSHSSGNTIYNNYFDNDRNAYDPLTGTNVWNIDKTPGTNIIGGSHLGGNYWSDYTGEDADGDGIGDTPYEIPGDASRDNLPLMKQETGRKDGDGNGGIISGFSHEMGILATLVLVVGRKWRRTPRG